MAVNVRWTPIMAIHPSAWNRNSANFAFWAFSEVAYLRTSYEAVPPALALPEMNPERMPATVVTTVSRV